MHPHEIQQEKAGRYLLTYRISTNNAAVQGVIAAIPLPSMGHDWSHFRDIDMTIDQAFGCEWKQCEVESPNPTAQRLIPDSRVAARA